MAHLGKGYVHLYTGNGKGKTTAALGLALRAAGAGLKVYIAQFAKGTRTGEMTSLKKFRGKITLRQFGRRSFIKRYPAPIDSALAARGIDSVEKIMAKRCFDVVILDELCCVCSFRLVPLSRVLDMIKSRPAETELIITGRNAPKKIAGMADMITEMKEIKHYFKNGVTARKGIEY